MHLQSHYLWLSLNANVWINFSIYCNPTHSPLNSFIIYQYFIFVHFCSEIDRKDLAVQMRKRVGDYSRVVDLLRTGGGEGEVWDREKKKECVCVRERASVLLQFFFIFNYPLSTQYYPWVTLMSQ